MRKNKIEKKSFRKMQCKACQKECLSAISQSVKNFRRSYWQCPDRCPKTFNGFIDDGNTYVAPAKLCSACETPCFVRESKSIKNPGKKYFACPNSCVNIWNGWVSLEQLKLISNPTNSFWSATTEDSHDEKVQPVTLFQDKNCEECDKLCVIHITRFPGRRATEIFYKCPYCNLFWRVCDTTSIEEKEARKE